MIEEGALENPHVEVVYGMHMMPDVPLGKDFHLCGADDGADLRDGFRHPRAGCHMARCRISGRDAVMAMAHLLTLLQTTVARSIDPAQPALLTIGHVEAGHQRNIHR